MSRENQLAIMTAVDDGLINGNLDAADFFFLLGAVLAVIAAAMTIASAPVARFALTLGFVALAALGVGLLVL